MTLPKGTIDKINAEAKAAIEVKEWGESIQINSYVKGATEWAGKAQPLTDAVQGLIDEVDTEGLTEDRLNHLIAALAKYKEVSNG